MMNISKRLFQLETENAFHINNQVKILMAKGKDIINLSLGQPDFFTPKNIVEACVKAIRDGHHGYTESNGLLVLREAVSESLNISYNVEIKPENILITPGGKSTIFISILILSSSSILP